MSLDADGKTIYARLEDITADRFYDGLQRVRDVEGYPRILRQRTGWATVLLAVQDFNRARYAGDGWGPVRFVLTRWIRRAGAWRRTATFNVRAEDVLLSAKAVIDVRACGLSVK